MRHWHTFAGANYSPVEGVWREGEDRHPDPQLQPSGAARALLAIARTHSKALLAVPGK